MPSAKSRNNWVLPATLPRYGNRATLDRRQCRADLASSGSRLRDLQLEPRSPLNTGSPLSSADQVRPMPAPRLWLACTNNAVCKVIDSADSAPRRERSRALLFLASIFDA